MTETYLNPPFFMGVPDSTGMGGLPTLGSSLTVALSTLLPLGDVYAVWPDDAILKRLAEK